MEEEQKILDAEELKAKISEWIKQGENFIFPQKIEAWKSCVTARANGIYNGRDLCIALEIIEKLHNGATLAEAKELLEEKNNSRGSYVMVSQIVFAFSKQGPEFLEYIMNGSISPETRKAIETKRRENLKLEYHNKVSSIQEHALERQAETEAEIASEAIFEPEKEEIVQEANTISEPAQETESIEEELPTNSDTYLQVRKDTFFSKIVNFIRNIFFSKKYKKNAATENSEI